ncbi:MAG: replication-associated recombination protein A [Candidatus Kinetoplastibacterium crithidii]|nr:MAG: replication-associated recombination protein A [Candidatus Kinetoplastibacterium crithidii]
MYFDNSFKNNSHTPLSEIMRPTSLDDFIGQGHLINKDKPLRLSLETKKLYSMVLWGPPGVGKTTLANLIARLSGYNFVSISAVLSGVKEIRNAIDNAKESRDIGINTIIFVDEVHRFNKSQQDIFLPYIEKGVFCFIGATTENPSFELNSALLSRIKVHILNALTYEDLKKILSRTLFFLNKKLVKNTIKFEMEVIEKLIVFADGDARRLISLVETLFDSAVSLGIFDVTHDWFEEIISRDLRLFDKSGDIFYDQISALHKSIRGSNPDAALYWFFCMIDGGVDHYYLIRRLLRIATEDIGLADPRAISLVVDCANTYERLGSPEGELALATAVIYMSCAPKSNAVYKAYKDVSKFSKFHGSQPVPIHLRNASSSLDKKLDYGKLYRYSHDEPEAYSALQDYFPEGLNAIFYKPTDFGLEIKIKQKLEFLRDLDYKQKKENKR